MRLKLLVFVLFAGVFVNVLQSQTKLPDDNERALIKASGIKTRTVREINLKHSSEDDSGFKSLEYVYDKDGQLVYLTRYHIFPDLTLSESYLYASRGLPRTLARINSLGDVIQDINYVYNRRGNLKREEFINYLNTVRTPFYFNILANTADDTLFSLLQSDLGIEPRLESYNITVNISDPDEENQYVIIGDENDPNGIHYAWSMLSPESQKGLLAWKENKTVHNVKVQYIEKIVYRNDKNGNRLSRKVYNTAGDMISSEAFNYNPAGKLSEYTKYKKGGSVSSKDTYTYDDAGNLTEINSTGMKTHMKFNDAGKITERQTFLSGSLKGKDVYTYDGAGNVETISTFDASNNLYLKIKFSYNDKGFLSSKETYDSDNKKIKIVRYDYGYYDSEAIK